jgi:hypothetical protein
MRPVVFGFVCLVSLCARGYAQEPAPAAPAGEPAKHSGAPLGQFALGSLVVTPTFQITSLAVDTNVRFMSERKADFLAAGGPGLDLALPFLDHWKLEVQGTAQYFYFHRTEELRRWTGGGTAALSWATTGTRAALSARTGRNFARPNLEVDARVVSTQSGLTLTLERDLGRLTLSAAALLDRTAVDGGQNYRGADLATALTSDRISVHPEFTFKLTPFSSLLLEGALQASRFPAASDRNFQEHSLGAGLRTTGLLKGQVTAGARRTRLSDGTASIGQPYLRGDLRQQVGRRLRFREAYAQESMVSAFAVRGTLPTVERRSLTLEIGIEISKRIDTRWFGTRETIRSDGLVTVVLDSGALAAARRDDTAYILQGDVGIRLGRARLALFGSFTTRESLYFSDLGIDGLQAGARVEYLPR